MRGLIRPLLAMLVLAVLAGTVVHAGRMAVMDLAMAGSGAGMQMPGCDGCDQDGDDQPAPGKDLCAAICAASCISPAAVPPAVSSLFAFEPASLGPLPATAAPAGLDPRPDPPPPKALALT
jgi:hypothetical protein